MRRSFPIFVAVLFGFLGGIGICITTIVPDDPEPAVLPPAPPVREPVDVALTPAEPSDRHEETLMESLALAQERILRLEAQIETLKASVAEREVWLTNVNKLLDKRERDCRGESQLLAAFDGPYGRFFCSPLFQACDEETRAALHEALAFYNLPDLTADELNTLIARRDEYWMTEEEGKLLKEERPKKDFHGGLVSILGRERIWSALSENDRYALGFEICSAERWEELFGPHHPHPHRPDLTGRPCSEDGD